jgi:putative DNA methylase
MEQKEIYDKRLIEETFPVKEISEESAKEKSVRQGHISTLHIWWARRPLASSRATNYAALVRAPNTLDGRVQERQFIIKLSKWHNSLDIDLMYEARKRIFETNNGHPPKILDLFAGGGAIPLEGLRLGCETYANDYNPVSILILKCTVEFPQKFGSRSKVKALDDHSNRLLVDFRKWANVIRESAFEEISQFYPAERDGSVPVGYIWARVIPCQNPSCNAEIPLVRDFWLVNNLFLKNHPVFPLFHFDDQIVPCLEGKRTVPRYFYRDVYKEIIIDFVKNFGIYTTIFA